MEKYKFKYAGQEYEASFERRNQSTIVEYHISIVDELLTKEFGDLPIITAFKDGSPWRWGYPGLPHGSGYYFVESLADGLRNHIYNRDKIISPKGHS